MLFEVITGSGAEFQLVPKVVPYVGRHSAAQFSIGEAGRLIFTHEPFSAGDRRAIYVARDARDVASSEYRWQQRRQIAPDDFEGFLKGFLEGKSNPWGSWGAHVERWLEGPAARAGRLHLVKFEDLRADTVGTLSEVVRFLKLSASSEVIEIAVANNSIDKMREKEDRGPARSAALRKVRFVGAGEVSGWKQKLTPCQAKRIESRFQESLRRLGYI